VPARKCTPDDLFTFGSDDVIPGKQTRKQPKNKNTKKTNKLVFFSILQHNLSKFVTQTGLYCSKQLETTFNQFGKNIVAYNL